MFVNEVTSPFDLRRSSALTHALFLSTRVCPSCRAIHCRRLILSRSQLLLSKHFEEAPDWRDLYCPSEVASIIGAFFTTWLGFPSLSILSTIYWRRDEQVDYKNRSVFNQSKYGNLSGRSSWSHGSSRNDTTFEHKVHRLAKQRLLRTISLRDGNPIRSDCLSE